MIAKPGKLRRDVSSVTLLTSGQSGFHLLSSCGFGGCAPEDEAEDALVPPPRGAVDRELRAATTTCGIAGVAAAVAIFRAAG